MKILLTGASGLVGGSFARIAGAAGHEVRGIVGSSNATVAGLANRVQLNLREAGPLESEILRFAPEVIVNCAAISEPGRCESEPEAAFDLNVVLPESLARAAARNGARLLHLSSEQVFDGTRAPYRNTDPVSPINVYAEQKIESERRVQAAAPAHSVTIRAPLLMGNSVSTRRSLHERLLADWSAGRAPKLFVDEFRQTCTAENLAAVLLELCNRSDITGVFHWAGAELLSRHEQGLRIREHFGLATQSAPIQTTTRAEEPALSAKRQANLALELEPLASKLHCQAESFAAQLQQLRVPPWAQAWVASHQR